MCWGDSEGGRWVGLAGLWVGVSCWAPGATGCLDQLWVSAAPVGCVQFPSECNIFNTGTPFLVLTLQGRNTFLCCYSI